MTVLSTNPSAVQRRELRARRRRDAGLPPAGERSAVGGRTKTSMLAAMVQTDADYRRANMEKAPSRCCSKCKTPYNCGNKSCRCHSF